MSSGHNDLPPYQEKPSSAQEKIYSGHPAGTIQPCSISDGQVDHFSIVRVSDSTYHLSLTADPTPIYRIELSLGPSKVGNVQIFSASDNTLPCLAAARASPDYKSKTVPVGTICTASPTEPDAHWRPITLEGGGFLSAPEYYSEIPVVKVPGRGAKPQSFKWEIWDDRPSLLWWNGPLPVQPRPLHTAYPESMPFLFATVSTDPDYGETLVHIRRGAGIDFQLSVILEAFLLLNLSVKVQPTHGPSPSILDSTLL